MTVLPPAGTPEDRAVGAFIGLAIGDALGTTLEFRPRDSYPPLSDMVGGGPFSLEPGEWTDDTSMALCLAESLLEHGLLNQHDLMTRFARWRKEGYNSVTGVCFDIGTTTDGAIRRFLRTNDPAAGEPNGAGNGAIMRLAPVATRHFRRPALATLIAIVQGHTTHGADESRDACIVLTRILVDAINGEPEPLRPAIKEPATDRVRAVAAGSWRGKPREAISSSGYVVDTLEAALWAVGHASDFRDAVLRAVNLGDDADTVGAVAGQIAGARWGLSGIPARWIERLSWNDRLLNVAMRLAHAGAGE